MKIAVLKADDDGRVAVTPETVQKLRALGATVAVERSAGARAGYDDGRYDAAEAEVGSAEEVLAGADVVLAVSPPDKARIGKMASGAKLIGMLNPFDDSERLGEYASAGVDSFAMELLPRITRAQSMDVLSSQANLAGYKAVIDAASAYGRAFPMMMTAAGTVAPAKAFVMGAGVAGLQAIATARRLGAVVSATDVRFAAKEQVESLGASFVTVDEDAMKAGETEGGYAKEMSAEFQRRQAEHVGEHLKKMDIVITTALIPGRPAPKLLTREMIGGMRPGSVIVDLAASRGGNIEGGESGDSYEIDGVKILSPRNILNGLPSEASNLYARNLLNFVTLITDKEEKALAIDWDDEIVKAVALTRGGQVVHERFGGAPVAPAPEPEPVEPEIIEERDV
jgi:NAD(P) transhydrogenase subunit alpha